MMALRRDGSSKRSASYMPYDASNSFVRKIANKVTGLVGWRSQSPSSVISQNYDSLSNSADEDSVSPTPKRIRMQSDEDDTSFKLIPCTSRGTNELCSPIQPVNNIKAVNTNNRNRCFVASTPADIFSSTSVQPNSKHQTQDSNAISSFDDNEPVNISSTIPQFNVHQRHNVTVPAISKDMSSQISNLDSDRKTRGSSVSNPRQPSFNIDAFSNSSRRLSKSICENRNVSSLSPFYSARTLYGGASALLPYGSPSISRLRSASTSRLNLFAPRHQITIQPVSPSPNNCNNDQETMSASARRILDTLEKYCSPVMDAKRIPVNELRRSGDSAITPQAKLSKGTKRKLPSLDQMTPNTTDLLRIKRQEKMQDSVSSARQIISSVSENTIAAEDSDASSDSTDLDYSSLPSDTISRKYIGKTRRKDEKHLDHSPLPPLKLPNAVLKITNLPKFDITDTFTFSKPLLLENLEQNIAEEDSEPIMSSSVKNYSNSPTSQTSTMASNDSKSTSFNQSTSSSALKSERATTVMPMATPPQLSAKPVTSWSGESVSPRPSSPKVTTPPWTCKVCLLESTDERCSSCTSTRVESKKLINIPKPPVSKAEDMPSTTLTSGWGDKFKVTSDTWECKECFIRNASTVNKCAACESPKPGAASAPAVAVNVSSSSELWKNVQKPATSAWSFGVPAKDPNDSHEKPKESAKTTPISFGFDRTDGVSKNDSTTEIDTDKNSSTKQFSNDTVSSTVVTTKPTYSFGLNTSSNAVPKVTFVPPVFPLDDTNVKAATTGAFTFGLNKSSDATDPGTCNAIGMKTSFTDSASPKSESEKSNDLKRNASVFNDVSSITNNARNPLLKTAVETAIPNDSTLFKIPKTTSLFETASANKENDDDKGVSKTLFSPAGQAGPESPSKKKSILFPSYSSPSVTSNIFGKGFPKPDMTSPLTTTNVTSTVGNSVTNVFTNSNFTLSKPANEAQITPSFGIVPNKVESISANDNSKSSKLFSGANNFTASVSPPQQQQQQQTMGNSIFGGFGGTKSESQTNNKTTFSATPMFSFGSSSSTVQPPAVGQQPPSGGFSFKGPKAEDTKFVFGSMTNSNFTTNNTLNSVSPPQFTSPHSSTNALPNSGASQFSFNTPLTNDQTKPMNSIFASATPALKDYQSTNNSVPAFGSSVFGNASQPPSQTMNTTKKPGGFSFPTPTPFISQPVNNFGSFGSVATKNQDQPALNSNATPGTSPYVFGSSNLPTTFNFTGGNAVPSFSAQPTAMNNVPSTGLPQRKIKKAVRRTAK